jgi:hypothetical protein
VPVPAAYRSPHQTGSTLICTSLTPPLDELEAMSMKYAAAFRGTGGTVATVRKYGTANSSDW